MGELRQLWRSREIVFNLARRDLKVRYKNSVLGFFWSFLNPVLQIMVYWFLINYGLNVHTENYRAQLFACFIPWMFFSQALQDGSQAVIKNLPLVKKVSFHRQALPLSSLASNFVHFVLARVVLGVVFIYLAIRWHMGLTWAYLPVAMAGLVVQVVFCYGLMLITCSLSVFYEDILFLLAALLNLWFFLSPVLYSVDIVRHRLSDALAQVYLLNPMAPPLIAYRSIIPPNAPPPGFALYFGIAAAVAAATLLLGQWVFRRVEWLFPEQA
jgi:lipopolysaccharide transport system permease protein